jgi:hypothetical protein
MNVPNKSSGLTSDVRVTVPEMERSVPIRSVRKERIGVRSGR